MLPRSTPLTPIPELTIRVAQAAFPKGSTFILMRDSLGTIFTDQDFADLFPDRGQPALSPWRLALVTVMQFVAGLSDRQAVEAVRSRIDWKYALSLELTDPGFDFSVLCEFRRRLIDGSAEQMLLNNLRRAFPGTGTTQSSWSSAHRLYTCTGHSPRRWATGVYH